MRLRTFRLLFILFVAMFLRIQAVPAQTTQFTYQGKLTDSGNLANGSYDLQFKLFDAATVGTGTQQGSTLTVSNVIVTNGIFTVQLDFGTCASCFNGADRFLEIAVKPTSGGVFTTLSPRQTMTSTPYAIKTTNLTFNGALDFGGTVFPATNTFAGAGAGVNTTPSGMLDSPSGKMNSFYGAAAGQANTTGGQNAFFGFGAGTASTSGASNSFFGWRAGFSNTTGLSNSFFGVDAGHYTTGQANTFIGSTAGFSNGTGSDNTFIGSFADFTGLDQSGDNNTLIGTFASVASGVSNGTAIGYFSAVTQSNSLVLGNNVNVGIGTTAPTAKLQVDLGDILVRGVNKFASNGDTAIINLGDANHYIRSVRGSGVRIGTFGVGDAITLLQSSGNVGIGTVTPDQLLSVNGNASKLGGGSWAIFSDERLKNINGRYTRGLNAVMQLQPIRFEYKADNALGLRGSGEYVGFSAQAVAGVVPEAVSRSASGYLQINNDPILWTMLNAVKEQQAQITQQQAEIAALRQELQQVKQQEELIPQQQKQLVALKRLVCKSNPGEEMCKP